ISTTTALTLLSVQGLIIDATEQQFRSDLDRARKDSNVKAVVVEISSPGGTVTDSNQMYNALLQYKAETGVPVYIHMDDLAASGGYYLACAGDAIYCEETTITGSIGVLLQYPQLSGFAEKTGIRFQTVIADGSPKKNFLDTFEEPSESDLAIAKDMLNSQYDLFASIVQGARSQQLADAGVTIDEVASGAVFVGPDAEAKGLVDGLGFLEDTVAAAAQSAGLSDPNVVRYERVPTLGEALGLAQVPAALQGEDAKTLAMELLHEATTPKALYLYRGAQ
ncbi:MAG: S49 family peptidase, partial [Planctomycetota bacterium]